MTEPAGTVALDAVVIVPTVKPAPVIAAVAAACVKFTTLGTATSGGPVETTKLTAEPAALCVPAVGLWLMTEPAATVALDAVVIVPTVKPAPVIAAVAAACVRFRMLGTATRGGPVETTKATALPAALCVPAVGLWLMTEPAATVALDAVVIVPTVKPAPVIAAVAAACVK